MIFKISPKTMWHAAAYLDETDFHVPAASGKLQQFSREQLKDGFTRLQSLQREENGWSVRRWHLSQAPAAQVGGYELGELFNAFVALNRPIRRHSNPLEVSPSALAKLREGKLSKLGAERLQRAALMDAFRLANPGQERAYQEAVRAELASSQGIASAMVTQRGAKPSMELAEDHARRAASLEAILRLHSTGKAPVSRGFLLQTIEQFGRYARARDTGALNALTQSGDVEVAAAALQAQARLLELEKLRVAMVQMEAGIVPGGGIRAYVNPLSDKLAELGHTVDLYTPLPGNVNLEDKGYSLVPGSRGSIVDPTGRTVTYWLYQKQTGNKTELLIRDDHYFRPRHGVYDDESGGQTKPFADKEQRLLAGAMLVNAAMSKVAAIRKLGGGPLTADQVRAAEQTLTPADVPQLIQYNDSHFGMSHAYLQNNQAFREAAPLNIVHNGDPAYLNYTPEHLLDEGHLRSLGGGFAASLNPGEWLNQLEMMLATMRSSVVSEGYLDRLLNLCSEHPRLQAAFQEAMAEGRLGWVRNGIPLAKMNPAKLEGTTQAAAFSAEDLRGRIECKRALQRDFDLPVDETAPVFAFGHRQVGQKGLYELLQVIGHEADGKPIRLLDQVLKENPKAQIIIGGPDVEPDLRPLLEAFAKDWPSNVRVTFGRVDNRRLMSGADVFLMPSRFEPCGIAQMEAQAMGAAVLFTKVDGLKDTVFEWNELTGSGTGFGSVQGDSESLLQSFRDAAKWASQSPEKRAQLQRNALELAQSFDSGPWAENQEALFRESINLKRGQALPTH